MKTPYQIELIAKHNDAQKFDEYCDKNNISLWYLDVPESNKMNDGRYYVQLPEYDMYVLYHNGKLKKLDNRALKKIQTLAQRKTAQKFDEYCDVHNITLRYLAVPESQDMNDGYYHVELPEYNVKALYYNGKLKKFN